MFYVKGRKMLLRYKSYNLEADLLRISQQLAGNSVIGCSKEIGSKKLYIKKFEFLTPHIQDKTLIGICLSLISK